MKDIEFAGDIFVLHPAGLLIWPQHKTAVVADLHLEKGSFYAGTGQYLPPQDTAQTLADLKKALDFAACKSLVFLGDSFHDNCGWHRMDSDVKEAFLKLTSAFACHWVAGNHDDDFAPPGMRSIAELKTGQVIFRHEAARDLTHSQYEISGHYHPRARLTLRGNKVSRPCFIQTGNRIILPAFGAYTGGLDVKHPTLADLCSPDYTAHLLGRERIYSIPSDRLQAA